MDNGTQLKFAKLTEALREIGIRCQFTPVYAIPQCNSVERVNRTIKIMIAQYVRRRHCTWDGHLLELQFAFNTATHDATGYSPAYLNHGRKLCRSTESPRRDHLTFPNELWRRVEETYELVKINLARAFQRQEHHYNLCRRDWRPKIQDV